MSPRIGCAHGVLVGCGQGRKPAETEMERNMRRLEAMLETMESKKQLSNSDDSNEEAVSESSRKKKKTLKKSKF